METSAGTPVWEKEEQGSERKFTKTHPSHRSHPPRQIQILSSSSLSVQVTTSVRSSYCHLPRSHPPDGTLPRPPTSRTRRCAHLIPHVAPCSARIGPEPRFPNWAAPCDFQRAPILLRVHRMRHGPEARLPARSPHIDLRARLFLPSLGHVGAPPVAPHRAITITNFLLDTN